MRTRWLKLRQAIKCRLGRHEILVKHPLNAAMATLTCKHCQYHEQVPVPQKELNLITDVQFREQQGVCLDITDVDTGARVLTVRHGKGGAIQLGRKLIGTAEKLGKVLYQSGTHRPFKKAV